MPRVTKEQWVEGVLGLSPKCRRTVLESACKYMSTPDKIMWIRILSGQDEATPFPFEDALHEESATRRMVDIAFKDNVCYAQIRKHFVGRAEVAIAGGSVLYALEESSKFSDVDVFVYSDDREVLDENIPSLDCKRKDMAEIPEFENYRRMFCNSYLVNVVKYENTDLVRLNCSVKKQVCLFDIDCCSVMWDGEKFLASDRAKIAIARKEIVFHAFLYNDISQAERVLMRLRKYESRGYRIHVPSWMLGPFQTSKDLMSCLCNKIVDMRSIILANRMRISMPNPQNFNSILNSLKRSLFSTLPRTIKPSESVFLQKIQHTEIAHVDYDSPDSVE